MTAPFASLLLAEALAEPFPPDVIGFKPQMVKNNRALAIGYVDARDVMDRLDGVVGPENWQDEYTPLPSGAVLCRLSVRFGIEWVTKCDVGGESEQPDKGDREKAAFSDALKRAAVKFGIGRYLYRLPTVWTDYDPVTKQVSSPQLPAWALPRKAEDKALYPQFAQALQAADTPEKLKAAYEAAGKEWKRLSPGEQKALATLKDACKAALQVAPRGPVKA